jgi:hypothetical protein
MATGIKRLQKIQWGKETTAGTAVPATALWRGSGNMPEDQRKINQVEENVGILTDTTRTNISSLQGKISLNSITATFEQLQYLFVMAFGGPTTGAADGSGSDKIYTTNFPTTTLPTATPYTIEAGDNFEVERMEYALCTKLELSGDSGGEVKVNAELQGRQVQQYDTGFALVSVPTVEDILFQKGKVYLDAIGGAYGTTQVANAIEGFKISMDVKWKFEFTADGNLYFTTANFTGYDISGELLYLHDSGVSGTSGAKSFFRNQAKKLLRLDFSGNSVTTGGTTYQTKHLILDLPIFFQKVGVLGDKDGTSTVSMGFNAAYDPTAGNAGKSIIVNEVATLA